MEITNEIIVNITSEELISIIKLYLLDIEQLHIDEVSFNITGTFDEDDSPLKLTGVTCKGKI